jgi:hypothetical protein
MTACPVFQIFNAVKAVSNELEQLLDDVVARLRKAAPDLFKEKGEWEDALPDEGLEWVELGGAFILPVSVREKGARGKAKVRHLSIRFDLNRELPEGHASWKHASEALAVVGYSSIKDRPWTNEYLQVTADGRLRHSDAWEACRNNRHAAGKLLQWTEVDLSDGTNWAERPWIFAVPVCSFKNPESVDKHLIHPVISLLAKNDAPDKSLAGTDAIMWKQGK